MYNLLSLEEEILFPELLSGTLVVALSGGRKLTPRGIILIKPPLTLMGISSFRSCTEIKLREHSQP